MGTPTLTDRDRALLARLGTGPRTPGDLATDFDWSAEDVRERLEDLAEGGLVRRIEPEYELTEDGRRAVNAPGTGVADDRIDVPDAVAGAIDSLDLRPDEADAVRATYALLRYWGALTTSELQDGAYSEYPAGYESADEWWEVVGDALAGLPDVEPPEADDGEDVDEEWRYAGTPEIDRGEADGRQMLETDEGESAFGSVRHALSGLDLSSDEKTAVRAAFDVLRKQGRATAGEIPERAYPDHPAGYEPDEWWERCVRPAFEELPGVERVADGTWRYSDPVEEPADDDDRAEESANGGHDGGVESAGDPSESA